MKDILITNDDGIDSEGIKVLASIVKSLGRVFIIAPQYEMSGTSNSIMLNHQIKIKKINKQKIAVSGTPTDCIKYGLLKVFKKQKPDIILSGINMGVNLGDDIVYSGTVGACFESALNNIPAVAFSVVRREKILFKEIGNIVYDIVKTVMKKGLPGHSFINVNIPNLRRDQIRGLKITKQGKRIYYDTIEENNGCFKIFNTKEADGENIKDSDIIAVKNDMVSITPLSIDFTDHKSIRFLKRIFGDNGS